MRLIKFIKRIYNENFLVFDECHSMGCTERNPGFTLCTYKGTKRRKLISTEFHD